MVTNVVTGGGLLVTYVFKKTIARAVLAAPPQDGRNRCVSSDSSVPPGRGCDMEEIRLPIQALEVVAREPDPKLSRLALRVLQKRYLKKTRRAATSRRRGSSSRGRLESCAGGTELRATEAQVEETAEKSPELFRASSSCQIVRP